MSSTASSATRKLEPADSKKSKTEPAVETVADDDETTKTRRNTSVDEDGEKPIRQLPPAKSIIQFNEQTVNPLAAGAPYSVRKNAAQAMMDGSLLFANFSQIRTLISSEHIDNRDLLFAMVGLSIAFQVVFALLIGAIWVRESHRKHKEDYMKALQEVLDDKSATDAAAKFVARESYMRRQLSFKRQRINSYLNYATIFLVLIITTINMLVASFGIKLKDPPPQRNQANATSVNN